MSHLVAFEIKEHEILVAAARTQGKRFQLTHLIRVPLDGADEDSAVGERLKKALAEHRISRATALAVVSRHRVEMRELTLPPAPDNELPEMVRFQARTAFASFNDQWILDFEKLSGDADQGQPIRVLATAMSPQVLSQIQTISDEAGLRLARVLLRPYCLVEMLAERLDDSLVRLVVDPCGDQLDLTLTSGGQLLATRSLMLDISSRKPDVVKRVAGEVRRTLASFANALPGDKVDEILLVGNPDRLVDLGEALRADLGIDVEYLDPLAQVNLAGEAKKFQPDDTESFAPLVGALIREAAGQRHMLDFLNPRKAETRQRDMRRTYLFGGLGAAAAICVLFLGWWLLKTQDDRIDVLTRQLGEIRLVNEGEANRPGVEQITGEVGLIDQWQEKNIFWIEELYQVSDRALSPDEVILDSLIMSASDRGVSLSMKGRLRDAEVAAVFKSKLVERPYLVQGGGIEAIPDDPDYRVKFDEVLRLATDLQAVVDAINERAREVANEAGVEQNEPDDKSPADVSGDLKTVNTRTVEGAED